MMKIIRENRKKIHRRNYGGEDSLTPCEYLLCVIIYRIEICYNKIQTGVNVDSEMFIATIEYLNSQKDMIKFIYNMTFNQFMGV